MPRYHYVDLEPETVALLKSLKGRLAIDVITKDNKLQLSDFMYNHIQRQKPLTQSFDSYIRDLVKGRQFNV